MAFRIGINGYGRIGRCVLRALYEQALNSRVHIVAINELATNEAIAYLTQVDSTHGRFPSTVDHDSHAMYIDDHRIVLTHDRSLDASYWPEVDLLLDCRGAIAAREHPMTGFTCPILRSWPNPNADFTVIYGFNQHLLSRSHHDISAASCTSNACVPVLKAIHESFGIGMGSMTTIHSVMNDQPVIDGYSLGAHLRKTRSALQSIIPVETDLAKGVERLLPELAGRLSARAMRVPVANVSAMELNLVLNKETTVSSVNRYLEHWANEQPHVFGFTDDPLTSVDYNHDQRSCIVDGTQTNLSGHQLLHVLLWFDNEWSYANRMIDITTYIAQSIFHQSTC